MSPRSALSRYSYGGAIGPSPHAAFASGLLVARIAGTTTSYVHRDVLGSIRAITDASGALVWATHYKPFRRGVGGTLGEAQGAFSSPHVLA